MRKITNVLLFAFKTVYHFASLVQLMTWILLHVLAFHPLERLRWSLAWISSLPMGLSPSYLFWWQLMWWVTIDVAVSVCDRSGLWPFRFVAVPVCGCFGLWPFRFVAVPVCGRFGLWPFRFVAVSVVAVSVCGRHDLLPYVSMLGIRLIQCSKRGSLADEQIWITSLVKCFVFIHNQAQGWWCVTLNWEQDDCRY